MTLVDVARSMRHSGWPGCKIPPAARRAVEVLLDQPVLTPRQETFIAKALDLGWQVAASDRSRLDGRALCMLSRTGGFCKKNA